MTGILLAAGIGSRLRPLTDSTPKCLLPVGGKTLLERTLRAFGSEGISDCVVVTGYRREMVEQAARSWNLPLHLRFVHNERFESTNNNYSLWLAGLHAPDQGILMMDADILFDARLLRAAIDAPHPDALVIRPDGRLGAEEIKVELREGFIRSIGKDVDPGRAAGESIGIEKFSSSTAHTLFTILGRRKEHYEFYEASFQELIDGGTRIAAVPSGSLPCMEIDTPQDLDAADRLARSACL